MSANILAQPIFQRIIDGLQCSAPSCDCHRPGTNGSVQTHCPAHSDANPSMTVTDMAGHLLVHCHTGCSQDAVIGALKDRELWHSPTMPKPVTSPPKNYDYRDAGGTVIHRNVRLAKKANGEKPFLQCRPDGNGGWIWDTKGVTLVPYRLPGCSPPPAPYSSQKAKRTPTPWRHSG